MGRMSDQKIKQRNQEIMRRIREESSTVQDLASEFNLTIGTLRAIVNRPRRQVWERSAEINQFFLNEGQRNIILTAQHFGVDYSSVRWTLTEDALRELHPNKPHEDRRPHPNKRTEPNERQTKMIAMYQKGHTLQEVGDEFGVTRERVRQIMSKFGVESRSPGRGPKVIDDLTCASIVKMYQEGASQSALIRLFSEVPAYRVRRILIDNGVTLRQGDDIWYTNPRRIPDEIREEAIKMYQAGASTVAVAQEFGVAQAWVHRFLKTKNLLRESKFATRSPRTIFSYEEKLRMVELYESGLSTIKVAKQLGIKAGTVASIVRRFGSMRDRGKK